jgi:hypothetical protein
MAINVKQKLTKVRQYDNNEKKVKYFRAAAEIVSNSLVQILDKSQ